jgi:RNA polymerase sigma-70 factor, ECF subfamily
MGMQQPNNPQNITHLIVKAKEGDSDAIGELYENYRLGVYRYLYYRTGETQAADDLTSEVFLRMIRSLSGYRLDQGSFQGWLYQIAHNLLSDHYRRTNGKHQVELEEKLTEDPLNPRTRPIERKMNSVILKQALQDLSGDQREVIVLRFIAGMPIAQVAQAMNRSEDAVKGLQRRALNTLREVLAEWEIHYA